ncbi:MAG: GNAT family N-acetyltransferase [Pirellulales bacterium]|nr:GNAT family N-acetyltransferase [Pirellulales bacterium]
MTETLEIHLANDEELRAAHANVHDVWSLGLPLDAHIQRRLTAAHHRRAEWIVGTLAGRVVCCLGLHPLQFQLEGRLLSGVGVASVHTLAEFRGRGFAPRLIVWAEEHARARGAQLSVLFCDVKPAYYERMGYLLAPAHRGELVVAEKLSYAQRLLDEAGTRFDSLDAATNIETLMRVYQGDQGREPLSIARSAEYWRYLIERQADDEFLSLVRGKENVIYGYARWKVAGDALSVRDLAVVRDVSTVQASVQAPRDVLYATLISRANQVGLSRVVGWLPAGAAERHWFRVEPRPIEITMFKPLVPEVQLEARHLAAADRINEIDHV